MRIADSCRVTEEALESEGLILERFLRGASESFLGLSKEVVVTSIVGDKKTNGRV